MAETTPQPTFDQPSELEEQPLSRFQLFVINHPRTAKVVAATGIVTSVVGVAHIARTVNARRSHLETAVDHAKAGMEELAATVDPASPEA